MIIMTMLVKETELSKIKITFVNGKIRLLCKVRSFFFEAF